MVKLVEKYFGPIPAGPKVDKMPAMVPKLDKHRFVSYTDNYARLPMMVQAYPTVPEYHPDRAALGLPGANTGTGKQFIYVPAIDKKTIGPAGRLL